MVTDYYVGYGMRDGKLLFISDVPRGRACGCECARCGQPLVAKKGALRQHHFAHLKVTNCLGAAESVLHRIAKELIAELKEISIPQYTIVKQRKTKAGVPVQHDALVAKGGIIKIENVRVEESEPDFVPDIVIESGFKSLILEVAVTHRVTRAKLRKIRRRDLAALELRLEPSDALLPRSSLKEKLQRDLKSKVWLFHPKQREAERAFILKYRDALAQGRAKFRHRLSLPRSLPLPPRKSSGPSLSLYDRKVEEFNRKHRRYPTLEECQRLWPHLWKKS